MPAGIHITEKLMVKFTRGRHGSVMIKCEYCGTQALFRKKNLKSILAFIKDHLHTYT